MEQVRENAYELTYSEQDGIFILRGKMGIIGPLANQLKTTSNKRKAATILRRLGYDLSSVGDVLYKKNEKVPNDSQ